MERLTRTRGESSLVLRASLGFGLLPTLATAGCESARPAGASNPADVIPDGARWSVRRSGDQRPALEKILRRSEGSDRVSAEAAQNGPK